MRRLPAPWRRRRRTHAARPRRARGGSVRRAVIDRRTTETQIALTITLEGQGTYRGADRHPVPRSHAGAVRAARRLRPEVQATGDLDVDQHHTVEDLGIALGEAVSTGARQPARHQSRRLLRHADGRDAGGRRHRPRRPPACGRRPQGEVRLVGDLQTELVHDFFEGFAHRRAGQRARQGALRPLEPPPGRSGVQGVCPGAARGVRERQAAGARCCRAPRGLL